MTNEQELRAWSLAIAVLMKGGIVVTDNFNIAIEKYAGLAEGIAAYIKKAGPHVGSDPRFK
jgi:hypothetical protein